MKTQKLQNYLEMKTESYAQRGQESQTTTQSIEKMKETKLNHVCSLEKPPDGLASGLLQESRKISFLYTKWPGKNYFVLKGRLVLGPNPKYFLVTLFFLIVISVPYFVFIFPEDISLISICAIIFFLFTFSSLLFAALDDPGIIPRKEILVKMESYEKYLNFLDLVEKKFEETGGVGIAKSYFLNGKMIMMKDNNTPHFFNFCEICKIYKPPLTKHCK